MSAENIRFSILDKNFSISVIQREFNIISFAHDSPSFLLKHLVVGIHLKKLISSFVFLPSPVPFLKSLAFSLDLYRSATSGFVSLTPIHAQCCYSSTFNFLATLKLFKICGGSLSELGLVQQSVAAVLIICTIDPYFSSKLECKSYPIEYSQINYW